MTFIVIGDFILNAQLLDTEHLNKQATEAIQILNTIINGGRWSNHPTCKMWFSYQSALKYYINCIIKELLSRNINYKHERYDIEEDDIEMPWWANWNRLHQSHRAMLYRKNPFYFHDKFTIEEEYLSYGYIWPNKITEDMADDDLELITDLVPKHLINPKYCSSVFKSGKRKGNSCNRIIKDEGDYCGQHLPKELKNKTCEGILKSGSRSGEVCGRKIKYYQTFCGIHNK